MADQYSPFINVWETLEIDEQDVIDEIVRLAKYNCWGCSSEDSNIRNHLSAHTSGCAMTKEQSIEWYAKEALFNIYFMQRYAWNQEYKKVMKSNILNKWCDS